MKCCWWLSVRGFRCLPKIRKVCQLWHKTNAEFLFLWRMPINLRRYRGFHRQSRLPAIFQWSWKWIGADRFFCRIRTCNNVQRKSHHSTGLASILPSIQFSRKASFPLSIGFGFLSCCRCWFALGLHNGSAPWNSTSLCGLLCWCHCGWSSHTHSSLLWWPYQGFRFRKLSQNRGLLSQFELLTGSACRHCSRLPSQLPNSNYIFSDTSNSSCTFG